MMDNFTLFTIADKKRFVPERKFYNNTEQGAE